MAKCNCCGLEMLTADGCLYKRIVVKGPRKKIFNRIPELLQARNFGICFQWPIDLSSLKILFVY